MASATRFDESGKVLRASPPHFLIPDQYSSDLTARQRAPGHEGTDLINPLHGVLLSVFYFVGWATCRQNGPQWPKP